MPVVFSNAYTSTVSGSTVEIGYGPSTGTSGGVVTDGATVITEGVALQHVRTRRNLAVATIPVLASDGTIWATADTVRMMTIKSNDRIIEMNVWTDSALTAVTTLTCDVGLALTGREHDGAVVDVNIFDVALDISTAPVVRADIFDNGALTDDHRYLPAWALAGIGDGTDTEDPMVLYDILLTMVVAGATTAGKLWLEVIYVAGD